MKGKNMEDMFLGHSFSFWIEVKRKIEMDGVVDFLEEIAYLRAKVSYYEKRISDMSTFMLRRLETIELSQTANNSAMLQGLKPHAGGTGTSA